MPVNSGVNGLSGMTMTRLVLLAAVLGVASSIVLDLCSRAVGLCANQYLRVVLYSSVVVIAVFVPMLLLQVAESHSALVLDANNRLLLIGIWVGLVWLYLGINWAILKRRLQAH